MTAPLTDTEIQAVINNPWTTSMDLHDLGVRVENERGIADPLVQEILTLEGNLVLVAYLADKADE